MALGTMSHSLVNPSTNLGPLTCYVAFGFLAEGSCNSGVLCECAKLAYCQQALHACYLHTGM